MNELLLGEKINPGREADFASIDPKGEWAVVMGDGRESKSTSDIMVENLGTRKGVYPGRRLRLVMPGEQTHAVFSTDSEWLYFITGARNRTPNAVEQPSSLQRINSKIFDKSGPYTTTTNDVQTIIPQLPDGSIERLSIFPDGEKLLLQSTNGIFVVSIPENSVVKLALSRLTDEEINRAAIKELSTACAGPTNDRVTFSGETTDNAGKVRQRIYSCRFDGSDVRAHTPKDSPPVSMHKFEGSHTTAFDLAKEWALSKIKWEDEQRRRQ